MQEVTVQGVTVQEVTVQEVTVQELTIQELTCCHLTYGVLKNLAARFIDSKHGSSACDSQNGALIFNE
jgi:hypothetical protein